MNLVYGCYWYFDLQFMRKKICIFYKGDRVICEESTINFPGCVNFLKLKSGLVYVSGWAVLRVGGVNLSNYKKGNIIKIYFQRNNNLVIVLLEENALQLSLKFFSSLLRYTEWVEEFRTFWIKIIEHICKFMTTKRVIVYQTINNQIIWSNESVADFQSQQKVI